MILSFVLVIFNSFTIAYLVLNIVREFMYGFCKKLDRDNNGFVSAASVFELCVLIGGGVPVWRLPAYMGSARSSPATTTDS